MVFQIYYLVTYNIELCHFELANHFKPKKVNFVSSNFVAPLIPRYLKMFRLEAEERRGLL